MKFNKLVLAGTASVMLMSAAAIPVLAQQADGKTPPPPRGPMAAVFSMLDTDHNGSITRDEFDADKAKIFAEIDKNGDKKLSYDEVKAWAKDVMSKMPEPGAGPADDASAPPPPPADGKAPPPPAPDKAADAQGPAGNDGPSAPGPMGEPDEMGGPEGHHMGHGMKHHGMGPGMHHMGPRERLAMMFMRADANDDGFVSQEEFNVFADQIFTRMDRNDDGALNIKDMPRHGPMGRWGGPDMKPNKG